MPLASGLGRRRGREPRVRRPPPPAHPNPSRKGGFVFRLVLLAAIVAALLAVQAAPAASPQRIVSLSPTATESLFAIGAGKQVVAVDDQSDYPKRAPRTSLSGYTPNVEAIANYHPDLVLISYNPTNFAAQLRS